MGYRRITRGRKAPSSKGKSNGTSKFKTRYRKMSGGSQPYPYSTPCPDSPAMKDCTDTTSNLGGEFSNRKYDMDSYENEVNNYITKSSSNTKKSFKYVIDPPPPSMFSRKSKLGPGMKTEYVDKRMQMGLFDDDGAFSFKRAKLSGIGLTVFLKRKPTAPLSCTDAESCKAAFFSNDDVVVTSNTAQVFFGRFAKSPTHGSLKDGYGLCYVVDTKSGSNQGRLYMGSWYQGKMNGLGIEVDFELTGDTKNPYKAIGIFFGYFFLGNRDYFGVYFFAADGKLHYVFYPRGSGNSCVIESSYDGDVVKQKEFKQAAKLSLSSAFKFKDGFVNLEHYEKFLRINLDHLVSTGGLDKSTSASLTDMDRQVYKAYKPVYNNFVTFCFGLLDMVRNEYVAKRDEGKTAEEKEAASKQSMEDAIIEAQRQGRLADIEDPRKKKETDIEIAKCITLLTSKGVDYDVISPVEKKRLEEEKLATIKKEHEELMEEKKGFEQAAINAALLNQTRLNRSSRSSSGPIMPPFTLSFDSGRKSGSNSGTSIPQRFGTPGSGSGSDSPGSVSVRKNLSFSPLPRRGVLLEPIAESMVESGLDIVEGSRNSRVDGIHHDGDALGGGKRTRKYRSKNMRTRMRMRMRTRAGTRRSRYGGEVSVV
jgi:hypothetical protein